MRKYVKGVYRVVKVLGDANIDVVIFDGERWWTPGWECGMKIGDENGSFTITKETILDLLYEWEPKNPLKKKP